ncbi:DUF5681 domain-containing protein [Defluviimonas salinarum]|uniref:DUF5681 domain-containing protein n=1 Tax=Defluviimonas salinarum TaxID=2992147 RepID=A0ABT3IYB5_9RHOB|nr:DUF5681 domain-containing protein [Defluviimonas salinarum]MCW3780366.1 DUF5681 domain-containing protein [Defluviimonas salinarum]
MTGSRSAPPKHGRFRKGQSGNPNGRPKKRAGAGSTSAFDIIVDKTLTITRSGVPQEVSVEEALQHRTYQDAIAGNRSARRDVLKMIAKREQVLAKMAPAPSVQVKQRTEEDPDNANAALLILGIASENTRDYGPSDNYQRLLLEPWAVQAALGRRRGGARLTDEEIGEIRRCTRDPDSLRWPRGTRA